MPAHSDWAANTYRNLSAIEFLPHAGFESSIPLYRFVALWSRRWRSAQMQTTCEGSQLSIRQQYHENTKNMALSDE